MAKATKPRTGADAPETREVAHVAPPRLPYDPMIEERFGVDRAQWKALCEAIYPSAKTTDAVVLALSYCRARKVDPFKRPVHIVPIWDNEKKKYVESVWPGIGELRTTAFRTGQYGGRDEAKVGPDIEETIAGVSMKYPEWCQVTVYRMLNGERLPFPGPRVYWKETFQTVKDGKPNSMWQRRPFGQLDKCAEAAALRAAFPEEVGNDIISDEARQIGVGPEHAKDITPARPTRATDQYQERLEAAKHGPEEPESELDEYTLVDEVGEVMGDFGPAEFADEFMKMFENRDGAARLQFLENNNPELERLRDSPHAEGCYGPIADLIAGGEADATAVPSAGQQSEARPPAERSAAPDPSKWKAERWKLWGNQELPAILADINGFDDEQALRDWYMGKIEPLVKANANASRTEWTRVSDAFNNRLTEIQEGGDG